MISAVDQRRLRDGAAAIARSTDYEHMSPIELEMERALLVDAINALGSVTTDVGAYDTAVQLVQRYNRIQQLLDRRHPPDVRRALGAHWSAEHWIKRLRLEIANEWIKQFYEGQPVEVRLDDDSWVPANISEICTPADGLKYLRCYIVDPTRERIHPQIRFVVWSEEIRSPNDHEFERMMRT